MNLSSIWPTDNVTYFWHRQKVSGALGTFARRWQWRRVEAMVYSNWGTRKYKLQSQERAEPFPRNDKLYRDQMQQCGLTLVGKMGQMWSMLEYYSRTHFFASLCAMPSREVTKVGQSRRRDLWNLRQSSPTEYHQLCDFCYTFLFRFLGRVTRSYTLKFVTVYSNVLPKFQLQISSVKF